MSEPNFSDLRVRRVEASQVRPLRHLVFDPGCAPEPVIWDQDDEPETAHFAVLSHGTLLGIATVMNDACPILPADNPWRLRGMAVSPQAQGAGLGKLLFRATWLYAQDQGADLYWCNARTPAVPFYEGQGLVCHHDQFDVPGAGPHIVMYSSEVP